LEAKNGGVDPTTWLKRSLKQPKESAVCRRDIVKTICIRPLRSVL
jgi:hypothetical protein